MIPKNISSFLYKTEQRCRGKGEIFDRLAFLNESQYYDEVKMKEFQFEKLKKLLVHSYNTVPYYKKRLDEYGIDPHKIYTYDEYRKVPILTRDQIIANRDDLISKEYNVEDMNRASSSGSTGQPLTLYHTKDFKLWAKAHQLRNYNWCGGYEIGDKFALLWGSEIYFQLKTYMDMFENKLMNRIEFNTFRLNEEYLLDMCKKLAKFQPKLISTYPSSLIFMSEVMLKHNLEIRPAAIQTTSETLTDADRKLISDRFKCSVLDKYGSRETNVIACECEAQMGMHINCENTFVEFLDKDGDPVEDGEIGEIIVTNLNNYGMPLIRYAIGDLGSPIKHKCKCGITLPLMHGLSGRESDIIITKNGDMVDSYFFSYLLQEFSEISYFQIVQETLEDININIVLSRRIEQREFESKISERIHHFTNNSFNIHYKYVDEIPVEASGKRRLTKSKVPFTWGARLLYK